MDALINILCILGILALLAFFGLAVAGIHMLAEEYLKYYKQDNDETCNDIKDEEKQHE